MSARKRSLIAGMTDYTGVSMEIVITHLRDWRNDTEGSIDALKRLRKQVKTSSSHLDRPQSILEYLDFFIDLFGRYLRDLERLLAELPRGVTEVHVAIVQQIYDSSALEERSCARFKEKHIEGPLKAERCRQLLDNIYQESRSMVIEYRDLSNLVVRLRTFVGTITKTEKELEQKFRILYSAAQESKDFNAWITGSAEATDYSLGVIFVDVDDFKRINTKFTESVVDKTILPDLQKLVRGLCTDRAVGYRHGGEEIVILLPNCDVNETHNFAEKLRKRIEAYKFRADDQTIALTISAGVASWPDHGKSLEELIEASNRAEHAAKTQGKNCVFVAQK